MRASSYSDERGGGAIFIPALLLCLITAMRLLLLDRIPGLNGDEALAGLRAHQVMLGQGDLRGLVPYTGGLYEYGLAAFLWLFGTSVFGLRFFPAMLGVLTVWIVYKDLGERGHGAAAFWGALLLGSSPLMVCYNRLAVDNYPFLLSVPVWCLILLERSKGRPALLVPCGFLLGLLVWCHFLGLAVMIPFLILLPLIRKGGIPAGHRIYAASFLAMALPVALRVMEILKSTDLLMPEGFSTRPLRLLSTLPQDLMDLLFMAYKTLDGSFVFLRFTGEVLVEPIPIVPALGLLVLVLGLATGLSGITRFALPLFLALLVAIRVLAPYTSIRYLTVANLCLLFLAVRWLAEIAGSGKRRRAVTFILSVAALYQVGLLGINYFYAFSRTGGIPVLFALDPHARRHENSVHMMENRTLYERLCQEARLGASRPRVLADPNLAYAMEFYDLEKGCLDVVPLLERERPRPGEWLLLYRITQWRDDQALLASVRRSGLSVKEIHYLSDTKFRVLALTSSRD
jgi:4-amino-4-deoxy-L-arabinose transferase-like glycosyltransferase